MGELSRMTEDIDHDAVIVPAALSDFASAEVYPGKIPTDSPMVLKMTPVTKILPLVRGKCKKVIGFKAESGLSREKLVARAASRMKGYGLTAVVADDTSVAGKNEMSAIIVTPGGEQDVSGTKIAVSDAVLDILVCKG